MPVSTDADVATAKSAYDFVVLDNKKNEYPLSNRRGHPTLFVNVASQCGLTKDSYASLVTLQDRYKDRNFLVLGMPCNQFASQEPGTDEEITQTACTKFSANFPILAKIDVNGDHASPLWKWLKKMKPGFLGTEGIKWNFTSFLVDGNGQVVERYSPGVKVEDVEKNLLPLLK